MIKEIFKNCNWRFPDNSIEDEYTGRYNYHDLILFAKEYSKIKEKEAFKAGRESKQGWNNQVDLTPMKFETFEDYLIFKTNNMNNKKDLPKLNQTYNYFDDGKINPSRRHSVFIKEIIPFDKIDEETLSNWKEETIECDWVYADKTDYFIKADLQLTKSIEPIIFVRTLENEWFSLGWWGGMLDVDGKLTKYLEDKLKE